MKRIQAALVLTCVVTTGLVLAQQEDTENPPAAATSPGSDAADTAAAQPDKGADKAPAVGGAEAKKKAEAARKTGAAADSAAEPAKPAEPAADAPKPAEPAADAPKPEAAKPEPSAAAKAEPKMLKALTDPALKQIFAPIKFEQPRLLLEAAAAVSLGNPEKTYFEWLVEKGDQAALGNIVDTVAGAETAESAEARAGTLSKILLVSVADERDFGAMQEVAVNACLTLSQDFAYVAPPGPPVTSVDGSYWMQPQASTIAAEVDWMFYAIMVLSVICFIGITVCTLYFTWQYRRRKGHKATESRSHNDALEITWTVLPSIIVVIIFVLGWRGFVDMMTPPRQAVEIQVVAKKWNWTFIYPNGWIDDVLHVPASQPVRLVMRSEDVLHDFSLPAFRLKQDVIPRRYTKLWFKVEKPGVYRAYCAEYCGLSHSDMKTWVQVHGTGGFEEYLEQAEKAAQAGSPVDIGKDLYAKRGCAACHSVDGSKRVGPSFKGAWGEARKFTDGSTGVVDEDYIRESLLEPQAKIREGFAPSMPTFKGQLEDWQIDGIIAYIKSLK